DAGMTLAIIISSPSGNTNECQQKKEIELVFRVVRGEDSCERGPRGVPTIGGRVERGSAPTRTTQRRVASPSPYAYLDRMSCNCSIGTRLLRLPERKPVRSSVTYLNPSRLSWSVIRSRSAGSARRAI